MLMRESLDDSWSNVKEVIPYGAGLEAYRTLPKIIEDFFVPVIIDADETKWGRKIYGIEIVGPDYLKSVKDGQKIIVTIAKRKYGEIREFLETYGLRDVYDFCHISVLATEWYRNFKGQYNIFTLDMAITTACTLKCKNCNMFIPYHKRPVSYDFENLKENVDLLFSRIDYIFAIGILGGEAFLNNDLGDFINYLNTKYKNQYGSIVVTTNGVIPPSKEIIETLKRNNILVTISDYKEAIKDKSKIQEIQNQLTNNGIMCVIRKDLIWTDFEFPREIKRIDYKCVEHMQQCDPGWRGLAEKKLYFCNCGWSAEKTGLFKLEEEDYIRLEELEANCVKTKEEIYKYCLGQLNNECFSFCKYCRGCGDDNTVYVEAGCQL